MTPVGVVVPTVGRASTTHSHDERSPGLWVGSMRGWEPGREPCPVLEWPLSGTRQQPTRHACEDDRAQVECVDQPHSVTTLELDKPLGVPPEPCLRAHQEWREERATPTANAWCGVWRLPMRESRELRAP